MNKLNIDYIQHYTFGAESIYPDNAENWIKTLEEKLLDLYKHSDIIFYQAGADPHINDPLGGVLTTEQMAERDKIVFKVARYLNIPVVWNLAGGYQTPFEEVLKIHQNTILNWKDIECVETRIMSLAADQVDS
jgi:acetoin utilization deacetylase AcuC-like enzyme